MTLGELLEPPVSYDTTKAGDILNDYWMENEKPKDYANYDNYVKHDNSKFDNKNLESNLKIEINEKEVLQQKTFEKESMLEEQSQTYDDKLSWLLIIFCILGQAMSVGFYYCFGVIYVDILKHHPNNESKIAWIGSLGYSACFIFGVGTAVLCKEIGCGHVMSLGGAFVGLGMITSSFAPTPDILLLTYGIITAFGTSCLFFSSLLCLPLYFKKYLTIANGIASAGSGLGGMALSPLLEILIARFGLKTTFQMYSILTLLPMCGGFLIRRKEKLKKEKKVEHEKSLIKHIDFDLLKNKAFLLFTLAMSLISFAYYIPYVHLVNFSLGIGISIEEASFLPSIICGASVCGKILFGYIGQFRFLNRLYMFQTFLLVICISITLLCAMVKYYQLCLFAIFFGLCEGGYSSFIILSISYVVKSNQLSLAFGIMYTVSSMLGILGPPFAGFLLETSGEYKDAFLTCGGFLMMGVISIFFMPWLVPKSIYQARKNAKHNREIFINDGPKEELLENSNDKNNLNDVISIDNESGVYSIDAPYPMSSCDYNNKSSISSKNDTIEVKSENCGSSNVAIYITNGDEGFSEEQYLSPSVNHLQCHLNKISTEIRKSSTELRKSLSYFAIPPFGSQVYLDVCLEKNDPCLL